MTGKEFETRTVDQLKRDHKHGRVSAGRYGVQGTFFGGKWQPIQSLPDIEGVLPPHGRQFVFDCKVCSGPSFPLQDDKFEKRQKKHLYERADYGAITFLLLHFKQRELKTKGTDPELTVAFPVFEEHEFWVQVDRAEVKRISRAHADQFGVSVRWTVGLKHNRPLVLDAILELESGVFKLEPAESPTF